MKPRIYKQDGQWFVKYAFPVRSFWVFGMNAEERDKIKKYCVAENILDTWQDALQHLQNLYRRREVRLR